MEYCAEKKPGEIGATQISGASSATSAAWNRKLGQMQQYSFRVLFKRAAISLKETMA
jgi:hypothetical protein